MFNRQYHRKNRRQLTIVELTSNFFHLLLGRVQIIFPTETYLLCLFFGWWKAVTLLVTCGLFAVAGVTYCARDILYPTQYRWNQILDSSHSFIITKSYQLEQHVTQNLYILPIFVQKRFVVGIILKGIRLEPLFYLFVQKSQTYTILAVDLHTNSFYIRPSLYWTLT